jgi:MoxR-like ATPase
MRERISKLLQGLSEGIYEREEVIRLAFLTAIAGESIFLLGPPGVAKSLIARRLKFAFKDGKSFEYLMNKFSTPDEIFGPVSIKKLKDEDKYERLTDKYLPGANVVFLDEIWKAGPSIQNALLTIINEKIYRNGENDEKVDIKCIISASNELPGKGEGLEALWDRFLIRYVISEIRNSGNFISMIVNTQDVYRDNMAEDLKIMNEELNDWDRKIEQIEIPDEVINTIQLIRVKLDAYSKQGERQFEIYDRRWKKAVRLLRTSAFLNGREKVDLMDCFLLVHCLWSYPEQLETLKGVIAEVVRKHGYTMAMNLTSMKKEIAEFEEEVKAETQIRHVVWQEEPELIDKQYYEVTNIGQFFEGKFIKYEEFERLKTEEPTTLGLYDEEQKLTYKIKAKRSATDDQSIDLYHASKYTTLPLKTKKVQRMVTILKKPHPVVLKFWDQRIANLEQYISALKKKTHEEKPEELIHLKNNLFVDRALSEIVEANMNDAINSLHSEALKVEKLKFYYDHLEVNEGQSFSGDHHDLLV